MRYEFRFQLKGDGRVLLDVPAHAEIVGTADDWNIGTLHINGARVDGSLFEAVHDFMESAGHLDRIDGVLSADGASAQV